MKNAPARKSDKSALTALKSKLIIAVTNPCLQQLAILAAIAAYCLFAQPLASLVKGVL